MSPGAITDTPARANASSGAWAVVVACGPYAISVAPSAPSEASQVLAESLEFDQLEGGGACVEPLAACGVTL